MTNGMFQIAVGAGFVFVGLLLGVVVRAVQKFADIEEIRREEVLQLQEEVEDTTTLLGRRLADCRDFVGGLSVAERLERLERSTQALHDTAERHHQMLRHVATMRAAKAAMAAAKKRPAKKPVIHVTEVA